MDPKILEKAGLTTGEAKVYLALLEIGESTCAPIVKKSGVSKSIVYHLLDKLSKKGLVSSFTKEKTAHFQAADPHKIMDYLHEEENDLKENIKHIEKLLPQLLLSQSMSKGSEARVYTGLKGVRTAHENSYAKLQKGDTQYYLGVPAYQPEEQHSYWQKDHRRRIKLGIKLQTLFNRDTGPKILENRNSFKGCDARYMPTGIKTPATFLIYKDTTTIILQEGSPIAVEIVNQAIADSFKAYFDEFWRQSNKLK